MKQFFLLTCACVIFILPASGLASSLIILKNGGKFVTSHYWEEGEFIKFFLYGGIVGFKKHQIKKVENTDLKAVKVNVPAQMPKAAPVPVQKKDSTTSKPKKSVENDKGKFQKLMGELDLLKKSFQNVSNMSDTELLKLAEDLIGLRNRIIKNHLGSQFSDQFVEIYNMADKIEEILKERGQ